MSQRLKTNLAFLFILAATSALLAVTSTMPASSGPTTTYSVPSAISIGPTTLPTGESFSFNGSGTFNVTVPVATQPVTQPASQPATQPTPPPPVITTQPVTPPIVIGPTTNPSPTTAPTLGNGWLPNIPPDAKGKLVRDAAGLWKWPGTTLPSEAAAASWIAGGITSASGVDPDKLIPTGFTPIIGLGSPHKQSTDYTDWAKAQAASTSGWVQIRHDCVGVTWDAAFDLMPALAGGYCGVEVIGDDGKWFDVYKNGPNLAPSVGGQLYVGGKNQFTNPFFDGYASVGTGSSSAWGIQVIDGGAKPSGGVYIQNAYFANQLNGITVETAASAAQYYTTKGVMVYHCQFSNMWGARYAIYFAGVFNPWVVDCAMSNINGGIAPTSPKDGSNMEQGIYINPTNWTNTATVSIPANLPNPSNQIFGNFFGPVESIQLKSVGGLIAGGNYFLDGPMSIVSVMYSSVIWNNAFEGDGPEFDPLTSATNGTLIQKAMVGESQGSGYIGTQTAMTGEERGEAVILATQNYAEVANNVFFHKPDPTPDYYGWLVVQPGDKNNPTGDPSVNSQIDVVNNVVTNYAQYAWDSNVLLPNAIGGDLTGGGTFNVTYGGANYLWGVTGTPNVIPTTPAFSNPGFTFGGSLGTTGPLAAAAITSQGNTASAWTETLGALNAFSVPAGARDASLRDAARMKAKKGPRNDTYTIDPHQSDANNRAIKGDPQASMGGRRFGDINPLVFQGGAGAATIASNGANPFTYVITQAVVSGVTVYSAFDSKGNLVASNSTPDIAPILQTLCTNLTSVGGGRIFVRKGSYNFGGSWTQDPNNTGQYYDVDIPVTNNANAFCNIALIGESVGALGANYSATPLITGAALPNVGVQFITTFSANLPNAARYSAFYAQKNTNSWTINWVTVQMDGIRWTNGNPALTGSATWFTMVDMYYASGFFGGTIACDTYTSNIGVAAQVTGIVNTGFCFPQGSNQGFCSFQQIYCGGPYWGIQISDHAEIAYYYAQTCNSALALNNSQHIAHIHQFNPQQCAYVINLASTYNALDVDILDPELGSFSSSQGNTFLALFNTQFATFTGHIGITNFQQRLSVSTNNIFGPLPAGDYTIEDVGNITNTLTGTTAGSIKWWMLEMGSTGKKFLGQVTGYENTTGTAQTIPFPVTFAQTPIIVGTVGTGGSTVSTTQITLPSSMGSAKTGWLIVEGN